MSVEEAERKKGVVSRAAGYWDTRMTEKHQGSSERGLRTCDVRSCQQQPLWSRWAAIQAAAGEGEEVTTDNPFQDISF